MKNNFMRIFLVLLLSTLLFACTDTAKDDELPVIDMGIAETFPTNCVEVYRGETFTYRFRISDNIALGSYSIEMHHNFDQHTHSTAPTQCTFDPKKTATNAFLFINQFEIEAGQKEFLATGQISIPANVDTGNYHFVIRVTDASGWQSFEGISLSIRDRIEKSQSN
jgi:hypothetical protein